MNKKNNIIPVRGAKMSKAPIKKELMQKITNLENTLYNTLSSLQHNVRLIEALSNKLEDAHIMIRAFQDVLLSKGVLKQDELKAEIKSVVEKVEKEKEEKSDKKLGLMNKGDDEVVEKGDIAIISYEGRLYGESEPFAGGVAEKVAMPVGKNILLPDFEQQLLGSKTGTTGMIDIQFPEDYSQKELAGQKAQFKVTVHKIKTPIKKQDGEKAQD